MTITLNSPLVGKGGTIAEARAALTGLSQTENDYINELFRLCQLTGLDFRILFTQFVHETAGGTSSWWRDRRNPAGIGVTGDPEQNAASPTFANGTDAARAQVAHMLAYVDGTDEYGIARADPRWDAVFAAGLDGSVDRLGDLGAGRWATDPIYAPQIAAKANQIFKEVQPVTTLTYGKVPYPAVVQSHLPADNPMVKTSGAPDIPDAVVWHRMIGTLLGTDSWFHQGHAATCYGIGCQATDGDANAGKIYEWIAPRSGWYGESSGPVSQPYGDGAALVNKVGINSVNRVSKAIEISGNYDTPLDEACRAAIVAMTAYWADQKHIPWNEFPAVPGEDRSFVVWHQEITIGTGKICPGPVVMSETPALIARTASYMRAFQVGGDPRPTPNYTPAVLPEWWERSLAQVHPSDADVDDTRYWSIRRNVSAKVSTARRSAPGNDAKPSGPDVLRGEKVYTERQVTGTDGKGYWLTNDGHYVLASKFSPAVSIKSR
jgi:hypothetical protein